MHFSSLKIGARLTLAFALILALMLVLAGIGLRSMSLIEGRLDQIVHTNVRKMALLNEMEKSIHVVARVMRTLIILSDEAEMATQEKKIEEARLRYNRAHDALEQMPASEAGKAFRANILALQVKARAINDQVLTLALANKNAEATALLLREAGPATQKWLEVLEQDVALQNASNEKDEEAARQANDQARVLMFAVAAFAALAGALLAWRVTRSVTGPIEQAVRVARAVAAGDLSSSIEVSTQDECGSLMQALKETNGSLYKIVGDVRSGSEAISSAAGQIASGNQDLAARSEQQASSLEETASAVEQLSSTVKQNGDNARAADTLATSASGVAVKGGLTEMDAVTQQNSSLVEESAAAAAALHDQARQSGAHGQRIQLGRIRAGRAGRPSRAASGPYRRAAQRADQGRHHRVGVRTGLENVLNQSPGKNCRYAIFGKTLYS